MLTGKLSDMQIFYINVDEEKDKNNHYINEFKKIDCNNVERISAIKNTIDALQKAIDLNLEYVMICENDIVFTDPTLIKNQLNYLFNSKIYFDVLILGINLISFTKINNNILRILDGQNLTGYIVHKHYYKKLLDNFLKKDNIVPSPEIDMYMKNLMKTDQWICFSDNSENMLNKINYNINKMNLYIRIRCGFGNNLLMVLNGLELQKKYNCNLYFVSNYNSIRPNITTYQIFGRLNYINIHNTDNMIVIHEKRYMYDDIVINDINNNYIVSGYYQSYKYFYDNVDLYKQYLFDNIPNIVEEMVAKYNVLKNGKTTVLIHFRIGDYVYEPDCHPIQTHEYYKNAISTFDGDYRYLIFSDNLELVKKYDYIKDLSDKVFIEETDIEKTFVLMSLCDNFIISNSSFSLCAYYFRNVKHARIVAPLKWFAQAGPKFDINDLVPDTQYRLLL